jgi:hypothetical protein
LNFLHAKSSSELRVPLSRCAHRLKPAPA